MMATIDSAPFLYRVPIEFWWFLEKKVGRMATRSIVRRERKGDTSCEPNAILIPPLVLTYRKRKAAERRALHKMGLG